MKPRARRIALIAASVPLETSRTISTDGIAARDPFGELDLELGGRAERGPARRSLPGRLHDLAPRVTEEQRAPRLHEVDIPVAVGVDHVGALAPNREPRGPTHGSERPNRRVHAAWDRPPRAIEELL